MSATDGPRRCPWADATDDYRAYHDEEWGRAVRGDIPLFERISLEAFQSGLSWLVILRKRPGFRQAFDGFDPTVVAAYDEADVARLLADPGIVRNRRKVEATIANARALLAMQQAGESLDEVVWAHAPEPRPRPRAMAEIPSTSPESEALSRSLKARGFRFVGPTTMYAAMQACGLVDDHLADCPVPVQRPR